MKALSAPIVLGLILSGGSTALARGPAAQSAGGVVQLQRGLGAVMATAQNPQVQAIPPGQTTRPVDPDQGDDHASPRAIEVVCSKSTPAAQRSAICPVPISPN